MKVKYLIENEHSYFQFCVLKVNDTRIFLQRIEEGVGAMKAKKLSVILLGLVVAALCIASFSFAGTITHEYDELNRVIRTIHPDGTVIEYTYDEAGNRLSVIKGKQVVKHQVDFDGDGVPDILKEESGSGLDIGQIP